MDTSAEKPVQTLRDRLKTTAAVVGLSLFGPAMLCTAVVWTINGKFPGRHGGGGLTASENPILFHSLAFVVVAAFLPVAMAGIGLAIRHALSQTSAANPAHTKPRQLLFNLHRCVQFLLRGYVGLFTRFTRRP